MTPLETLQKYGLPTDLPSIKKRLTADGYMIMAAEMSIDGGKFEKSDIIVIAKVIKFCDLALLCSLAEKGERYEKAVKANRDKVAKAYSMLVESENVFAEIITEAEGE